MDFNKNFHEMNLQNFLLHNFSKAFMNQNSFLAISEKNAIK